MTEQRLEPGAAATLAHNTLSAQISALINITTGAAQAQANGLQMLLDSNMAMVVEASNEQADAINTMIDELESRDRDLISSGIKLSAAHEEIAAHAGKIAVAESLRLDAESALATAELKNTAARAEVARLERELKALKSLDPEGTRKRIKAKQAELDKAKKQVVTMQSSNIKLKAKSIEDDKKINTLCKTIEKAQADIDALLGDQRIDALWRKHLNFNFYGQDSGEYWYAYTTNHGLSAYAPYILATDWTIFIVNQNGCGATVLITEWLEPVVPLAEHTKLIPSPMVKAISAFATEALGAKADHLLERKRHFSSISVRTLPGIQNKYLDALEESGIKTITDVMINRDDRIQTIKGIGTKTANIIYTAAANMVALWEREQEEVKEAA